jgi:FMN-dependent NADH-azoreductase
MKITREALKNIVKETMIEESEYQEFFKRALEKAGKSIPSMSDEEKKAFFNNIEKTWKGKGPKKEISETELEEAQSPAQKAAFQKMLDKKKGKDGDDDEKEEVKESIIKEEEIRWSAVENAIIKYIKYNVKVLEKPIKAKDEAGTVKMLKAFIDGLVNAQKSLKLRGNFK